MVPPICLEISFHVVKRAFPNIWCKNGPLVWRGWNSSGYRTLKISDFLGGDN